MIINALKGPFLVIHRSDKYSLVRTKTGKGPMYVHRVMIDVITPRRKGKCKSWHCIRVGKRHLEYLISHDRLTNWQIRSPFWPAMTPNLSYYSDHLCITICGLHLIDGWFEKTYSAYGSSHDSVYDRNFLTCAQVELDPNSFFFIYLLHFHYVYFWRVSARFEHITLRFDFLHNPKTLLFMWNSS